MSLTRKASHGLQLKAAAERNSCHPNGSSRPSLFVREESGNGRAVRRLLWFVLMMVLGVVGCTLSMSGVLLTVRQETSPLRQVALAEWEQACLLGLEPETHAQTIAEGKMSYQGSVPGPSKFQADYEIYSAGAVTLADLLLTAGRPQAGCLDYGRLHGEPVIWVRLILGDGRIEAYSAVPSITKRLMPDAPVYVLYCYELETNNLQDQPGNWRGLVSLDSYESCRHSGTATPP